jgi:hypothetical protein
MDNMGIVVINEGDMNEKELEQNSNEMWKVKWFWQIRKMSEKDSLLGSLQAIGLRIWWNIHP